MLKLSQKLVISFMPKPVHICRKNPHHNVINTHVYLSVILSVAAQPPLFYRDSHEALSGRFPALPVKVLPVPTLEYSWEISSMEVHHIRPSRHTGLKGNHSKLNKNQSNNTCNTIITCQINRLFTLI